MARTVRGLYREPRIALGLAFCLQAKGLHRAVAEEKGAIMKAQTTPRKAAGKATKTDSTRQRYVELKRILEERRREILAQVQEKMRDVRAEGGTADGKGVLDAAETSEADIQDDIEFALIQMKSETLHRIEEALARLESGQFGDCFECGDEISERRLRALPFAVRCKDCEEAREVAERRERLSHRRSSGLMLDMN